MQRQEFETMLITKAKADPAFRQALLSQPMATIEQELGFALPEWLEVKVVEETATTLYLVLPPPAEAELSDESLEQVSGGATSRPLKFGLSHVDPICPPIWE
ncbi:MAG: NHLP leader peptide family RiPP precursor [Anaerolineae bacterium]|nr:NHLP leader peptide family RiPP precursor [Anaerolineae bacterium]